MLLWKSTLRDRMGKEGVEPTTFKRYMKRIAIVMYSTGVFLRVVAPGPAQAPESYLLRNNDTGKLSLEKIIAWVFIIMGTPLFWFYFVPSLFGFWK